MVSATLLSVALAAFTALTTSVHAAQGHGLSSFERQVGAHRLGRRQNGGASSIPCSSGVFDPDRRDTCCRIAQVYSPTGNAADNACCPLDKAVTTPEFGEGQACCEPNEQSGPNAQCCGFTEEGQAIESTCDGCCTADRPISVFNPFISDNPDLQCCSNEQYLEETNECCLGGVSRGTAPDSIDCCTATQEPHVSASGEALCCEAGTYDEITQTCGDGQLGARCASDADCFVEGQSCASSDDPTLQRCRVSDGNSCSADTDCGPSSTCNAIFSDEAYTGSVCRASGTGPAPDTLRGRCGSDPATVCDQVAGGGTCVNTGSTTYCAANTGASCDTSADCAEGVCSATVDGVCQPPAVRRSVQKIRRRDIWDVPVDFVKRDGARRHLLDRSEAAELILNHGVFMNGTVMVRDPKFMVKRSRYSAMFDASVRRLTSWAPEITVDQTMKLLRHESGQLALSDNFKIDSSDAPFIVDTLLASPSFKDFDFRFVTIDREVLELLQRRLRAEGGIKKRYAAAIDGREL